MEEVTGSAYLLECGHKAVLDNVAGATWLKDAEGRYVHVNKQFLSLYRLSIDETIGKKDEDLFPPDLATAYTSNDRGVMSIGRTQRFAEFVEATPGRRLVVETVRIPIFDGSRSLIGTAGIAKNAIGLVERKEPPPEDTAAKSEAEYRTIFEKALIGIFRISIEGRILNANPAAARILGFASPEEMIGAVTHVGRELLVDEDDQERLLERIRDNVVVESFETRLYRKDGTIVRVLLNLDCIRNEQGGISCLEGTAQDITETRKAEEALRQAEEKYRDIYENAIEGIFQTTPDGRFISANPALARILGYESSDDLLGSVSNMEDQVYVSERRRKEYAHLIETQGVVRDFEVQARCKDGSVQWVSINSRSVRDDGGNILYHEGTIENVTERKRLEAQLRHAQKMESIGTLAGGVAHDFNNILTTVMGYCSLMMMKAGKGHPLLGYVDQIMEAATRASTLTQSLLSFSRKQAVETRAVEVNDTIRGVEKLLRRIIGEDVELRTALSPENLIVVVGDGQIGQLLMNLATNARDAMPDGGTLTIRTERVHLSGGLMKTHEGREGTFAAIEVSDTGTGMDERTKDQIFDPFFTTKEVGKGTGLGLSIVYGIVNQNKGYVNVSSDQGRGTTFTIYLPLAEAEAVADRFLERAELRGGNETILVAEDNLQVREIVTTTLRDFGYTVTEAFDGADAVEKFKESPGGIDLLLLDVIMPRKNGKEAYTELKRIRPDIRAIFMSGYTGDILSRKGISREGIPMIAKPIVIEKLLRVIREVLDTKPSQLSLFP